MAELIEFIVMPLHKMLLRLNVGDEDDSREKRRSESSSRISIQDTNATQPRVELSEDRKARNQLENLLGARSIANSDKGRKSLHPRLLKTI